MTSTTIGSGAVDVVVVVVGAVDEDVVEATAGVVVIEGVAAGAVEPRVAKLLGLLDRRKINPAPIEEAAAAPKTASVRINARR